jgi:hypothetical protein
MTSTTDEAIQLKPFEFGAHVRYIGRQRRFLPAGTGREVVLAPGMVGVVILSGGGRCRLQFRNGFQLDVTPENRAQFEPTQRHVIA